jgi:hypothetical protein
MVCCSIQYLCIFQPILAGHIPFTRVHRDFLDGCNRLAVPNTRPYVVSRGNGPLEYNIWGIDPLGNDNTGNRTIPKKYLCLLCCPYLGLPLSESKRVQLSNVYPTTSANTVSQLSVDAIHH